MKVYRSDGSFVDDPNDTEFGWFFNEIIVDESILNYQQRNRDIKMCSFLRKSLKKEYLNDSMDNLEEDDVKPIPIEVINPNIKTATIKDCLNCDDLMNNLFEICTAEEFTNIENEKEKLINSLSPCSIEAKMLLCVISHSKFKSIQKTDTSEELLRSVNFKSTNLKFLLSEKKSESNDELFYEMIKSKNKKEENTKSLMLDLISSDIDCTVNNLEALNDTAGQQQVLPQFIIDTSDLGNSIPSSSSSRNEKCDKHYLQLPPDKSSILSSLGLGEEEKSIQSYCEETFEMHKELVVIKRCFKVSL